MVDKAKEAQAVSFGKGDIRVIANLLNENDEEEQAPNDTKLAISFEIVLPDHARLLTRPRKSSKSTSRSKFQKKRGVVTR